MDVAPLYSNVHVSCQSWTVVVRLPLSQGTDVIHQQLTKQVLMDPKQALRTIKSLEHDQDLTLGILHRNNHRTNVELDNNLFERQLSEHVYQAAYYIMTDRLKQSFLGEQRKISTENEVMACKQCTYDQKRGAVVQRSVDEYFNDYLNTVRSLDRTKPYPIDIASTFFHGLATQLKKLLTSDTQFQLLPKMDAEPHPASPDQLRAVRDAAKQQEASLCAINKDRVPNSTTAHTFRGGRSFLAIPGAASYGNEELFDDLGPDGYEQMLMAEQSPQGSSAFATMPAVCATSEQPPHSEFVQHCIANALMIETGDADQVKCGWQAFSVAEQAMKQSEAQTSRRKCWGCGSDTHLWQGGTGCPDQDNPVVQQKARESIRAFTRQPIAASNGTCRSPPRPPSYVERGKLCIVGGSRTHLSNCRSINQS